MYTWSQLDINSNDRIKEEIMEFMLFVKYIGVKIESKGSSWQI